MVSQRHFAQQPRPKTLRELSTAQLLKIQAHRAKIAPCAKIVTNKIRRITEAKVRLAIGVPTRYLLLTKSAGAVARPGFALAHRVRAPAPEAFGSEKKAQRRGKENALCQVEVIAGSTSSR